MSKTNSPLRYPGGKSCLYDTVSEILRINKLERCDYVEPYAGGCGLALALLFNGNVSSIYINDIDVCIWSFWNSVLNDTDALIDRIDSSIVNLEEWHIQKEIVNNPSGKSSLDIGYATFFLNRTNRSGIIKNAGVIGGYSQNGNYKIDCRFNKEELKRRIKRISRYKNKIKLSCMDALDFIQRVEKTIPETAFYCIDPPYYNKGSSLYTSFYSPEDHSKLSSAISSIRQPWILTYDNVDEIKELYDTNVKFEFGLNYSLQSKRVGTEVMILSDGIEVPISIKEGFLHKSGVKAA